MFESGMLIMFKITSATCRVVFNELDARVVARGNIHEKKGKKLTNVSVGTYMLAENGEA